jgi:fluoroquinolone transport system permease protein
MDCAAVDLERPGVSALVDRTATGGLTMNSLRTLRALSAVDALSVSRDSLLRGIVFVPLGLAVAARWLFPPAIERTTMLLPFDLQALYPHVMSYVLLLLAPAICGAVVGFMLLDQRDDNTLMALQVTPLPIAGYLAYRLAAPMVLSTIMGLIALPLSGLVQLDLLKLLMAVLAAALLAPITALFLGAYAANKVQGFALQKALGVFFIAPFAATLLPQPWQLLAGVIPTYWPATLLWTLQSGKSNGELLLLGSLAYQGLLLALLLRRFNRVIRQ